MTWLKEHGLISSWRDYEAMPLEMLEDARLLMRADATVRTEEKRARDARSGRRRIR